jgi:AraC-like DNA-binding protein
LTDDFGRDDRRVASTARALALVEERLRGHIDVAAMADAACYSLFHFIRVFTELTGHGPYDYLMRRRIAEAAKEAVANGRPLIDIALDYGFESPDGFTRAFKRCFGLTPSDARRLSSYPERYARTALDGDYLSRLGASGLSARPTASGEAVVAGTFLPRGAPFPHGAVIAIMPADSDPESLVFVGRELKPGEGPPAFPAISSAIQGGDALTASSRKPLDLGLAREYLYRTAAPVRAAIILDGPEIVRLDGDGRPESLSVPIRPRA